MGVGRQPPTPSVPQGCERVMGERRSRSGQFNRRLNSPRGGFDEDRNAVRIVVVGSVIAGRAMQRPCSSEPYLVRNSLCVFCAYTRLSPITHTVQLIQGPLLKMN